LNALDNTEARRHVNRICLSLNISFVESGTQGFIGQVIPIIPHVTSCWECTPKESNKKTYPICTIRATPDKPVHCIVWSKQIFGLLFGINDDSSDVKDMKNKMNKINGETNDKYIERVFEYLFKEEIEHQMSMKDLKDKFAKMKKLPRKIGFNSIQNCNIDINNYSKTKTLNEHENAILFIQSFRGLLNRNDYGKMIFDKDDNLQMCFINSCSNLRMYCYHIQMQSEFDNKGIAGNIIHAIATTNAIVAGVMVVQCIHLLRMNKDKRNNNNNNEIDVRKLMIRSSWVNENGPKYLYAQNCDLPNPNCSICQNAIKHLIIKKDSFTFGDFINKILKKEMGFKQPDIAISHPTWKESETNMIECLLDDDDIDDIKIKQEQFKKKLDDPSIKILNNGKVMIEDFSQDVKCHIVIHYLDLDDNQHPTGFELQDTYDISKFKINPKPKIFPKRMIGKKRKKIETIQDENEINPFQKKTKS